MGGRMIHTDISKSDRIASLSSKALALFALLIPHYNSHGKMNGEPHFIKGEVCPKIKWLTIPEIIKCMGEISKKTNVKWFQCGGLWYLQSLNWKGHQPGLRADRLGDDKLPDYSRNGPGVVPREVEVEVEREVEVEVEREGGAQKHRAPLPDIKKFIDYAFLKFQKYTGEKLHISGKKDGAIVKKLLSTYGLDRLKGLWDVFMRSDDPFIRKAGYSIGVFSSQVNKLVSGGKKGPGLKESIKGSKWKPPELRGES